LREILDALFGTVSLGKIHSRRGICGRGLGRFARRIWQGSSNFAWDTGQDRRVWIE
jgi:hypothetical protein